MAKYFPCTIISYQIDVIIYKNIISRKNIFQQQPTKNICFPWHFDLASAETDSPLQKHKTFSTNIVIN